MLAGEKKIGDKVFLYAEPGLLTITIKPEIGPFQRITAWLLLAILALSALFSVITARSSGGRFLLYLGVGDILICAAFCGILADAFLTEKIQVSNGILVHSFGPFGHSWSRKTYQVSSITNLRTLIPTGRFRRPHEYYLGWGRPAIRGTVGFDYENNKTVDLAREIDRVTATYLVKELHDHGKLPVCDCLKS